MTAMYVCPWKLLFVYTWPKSASKFLRCVGCSDVILRALIHTDHEGRLRVCGGLFDSGPTLATLHVCMHLLPLCPCLRLLLPISHLPYCSHGLLHQISSYTLQLWTLPIIMAVRWGRGGATLSISCTEFGTLLHSGWLGVFHCMIAS